MGSDLSLPEDIVLRLVANTLEYVLVKWNSPDQVEVVKSSYQTPWFDGSVIDLQQICRYKDLVELRRHHNELTNNPSEIFFSIRTTNSMIGVYGSSQLINKEGYSLWLKLPEPNKPMQYLQDAVHDMKSPVNAIIGVINLMQHEVEEPDAMSREDIKTYMDLIKSNAA